LSADAITVDIQLDSVVLPGILTVPPAAVGLVVFAHGSGSSRLSPRNAFMAEIIQAEGMGTLLFDLLTEEEDIIYDNRFDIDLIANRLLAATDWLLERPEAKDLSLGYFGASTGAAAALKAAVHEPHVRAIVSRGGRPDLALDVLPRIRAATLLVVGSQDTIVIDLNRHAYNRLQCEKRMEIVPGASHLFEEPGTLDVAAQLAAAWFKEHLQP
jgi:dienelactone hydrolase